MSSVHMKILDFQADSRNWEEFEKGLLEKYDLNNSLQMSKKELM